MIDVHQVGLRHRQLVISAGITFSVVVVLPVAGAATQALVQQVAVGSLGALFAAGTVVFYLRAHQLARALGRSPWLVWLCCVVPIPGIGGVVMAVLEPPARKILACAGLSVPLFGLTESSLAKLPAAVAEGRGESKTMSGTDTAQAIVVVASAIGLVVYGGIALLTEHGDTDDRAVSLFEAHFKQRLGVNSVRVSGVNTVVSEGPRQFVEADVVDSGEFPSSAFNGHYCAMFIQRDGEAIDYKVFPCDRSPTQQRATYEMLKAQFPVR
jgi:hypothetical protein